MNQVLEDLPAVSNSPPGRITIHVETTHQALEKLLALAMAIGNEFERLYRAVGRPST